MLDGPGLVDAVRTRYPLVPVVLLTAQGMAAATARALRNGAAGYVPKSQIKRRLTPTVARLLANATVNHQRYDMLQNLTQIEITFCLANNSRQVPSVVSFLQEQLARMNLCDETDRIRVGVALEEAITNAIYHGNLQVSSELREQGEDVFHAEATRRRLSRPYRDRHVRLTATITHAEARFVIVDEGPGFNRANLPDPTDPANLDKPSGRGLLLIHHFMDEVKHNQAGNQITLIKRRHAA
jgi:anti-sigma regulatory factor (Ser/Thr protein kinase)